MIDYAELTREVLNMVVLEQRDDQWHSHHPLPEWFCRSFLARPHCATVKAFGAAEVTSAFVEHLLEDASRLHDGQQGERITEIWSESNSCGQEEFYGATAQVWRDTLILMIRRLGHEFEQHANRLQSAREELLTTERLEAEVFRRTRAIREREEEIALRLLAASRVHDTETGAHVRRIGLYSAAMAVALGWSAEEVAEIRVAAPMHDIGKIGIPDRVLKKPGPLDDEEWQIMQRHSEIGATLLASDNVRLLQLASEIALSHHENFDGSGYPRGLAGQDIPIAARIVTIVDVYDALVHRRVYKAAMDESVVIEHMRGLAGERFDPVLLEEFFGNLDTMRKIRLENPDELDESARDRLS